MHQASVQPLFGIHLEQIYCSFGHPLWVAMLSKLEAETTVEGEVEWQHNSREKHEKQEQK